MDPDREADVIDPCAWCRKPCNWGTVASAPPVCLTCLYWYDKALRLYGFIR